MPIPFRIYLRNSEIIEIHIRRFKIEGDNFTFYSTYDQILGTAYVSFKDVIALVPTEFRRPNCSFTFRIYLREHTVPIEIPADAYQIVNEHLYLFANNFSLQKEQIENIYIPMSEVVAIIPVIVEP